MAENKKKHNAIGISLWPHQRKFVDKVVRSSTPARFTLTAPPGTGKGIALAAVAQALYRKKKNYRCLVVAALPVQRRWQARLKLFTSADTMVMTSQKYRYLQANTKRLSDIWSTVPMVIASSDLLSSEDLINEITLMNWDLMIVDTADVNDEPRGFPDIIHKIWSNPQVSTAIALGNNPDRLSWFGQIIKAKKVRWAYNDLYPIKSTIKRRINRVNYKLTKAEREVIKQIARLLCQRANKVPTRVSGYALIRRLRSSLYAFDQMVRRLIANRDEFELYANERYSPDRTEIERWEDIVIPAGISAANIDYDALRSLTSYIEKERKDLKFECFLRLIDSRGLGMDTSTVVMTEYSDTAQYLESALASRDYQAKMIRKDASIEEHKNILKAVSSTPTLLIGATEASWLGFGFADQMIHYDLPLTPEDLLRRFISIEKSGRSQRGVEHFFIVAGEKTDEDPLHKLLIGVRNLQKNKATRLTPGKQKKNF